MLPRTLLPIAKVAGLSLALLCGVANAALDQNIKVALEEPFDTFPTTGISTIRGWAVGPAGIDRVELYIDDVFRKEIPYRGPRGDVCNSFPNYPNCERSGFAMAMNFNNLGTGTYTFKIKAIAPNGDHNEVSSTIEVTSFHAQYFANPNVLALGSSSISAVGNDLVVRNAYVDNQPYDLTIRWNKGSQAPELYAIDPASGANALYVAGNWDVFSEMDATSCGSDKESARQGMIFTQSGDTVNFDGQVTGTLIGSRLTLTENYSDGSDAIVMNWVIDFNNDATFLQGSGNWVWTNADGSCQGVTSLLGRRTQ
jgi:hypothetical protein